MEETIVAQASARGSGGVAIVRLSGSEAEAILHKVFIPSRSFSPWKLVRGQALDAFGEAFDDALAVFMPGPRSFTGEDIAEIHCHGGQAIVQTLIESCLHAGARLAERGEFSRRAYLNGRMDLSQAEAIAEMIAAPSREAIRYSFKRLDGVLAQRVESFRLSLEQLRMQLSLAVDFPDDEVESLPRDRFLEEVNKVREALEKLLLGVKRAELFQKGALVVLAGAVNAGKSSLLNAFLGRERALVTDIPGTTRDFLEESIDLDGLAVRLVDTAGLRHADDKVEALGIERSKEKVQEADCVVLLVDGARLGSEAAYLDSCPDPVAAEILASDLHLPLILVWNKADICLPACRPHWIGKELPFVTLSAKKGEKLDELAMLIQKELTSSLSQGEDCVAPNLRQAALLQSAKEELDALALAVEQGFSYDILAVHLDLACLQMGDSIGLGTSQDVLNAVFKNFCIGK